MTATAPLTRWDFRDLFTNALDADSHNGQHVDEDTAWGHYQADPARWHAVSPDNPTGDVLANFVLDDGPWWVDDEPCDCGCCEPTAATA